MAFAMKDSVYNCLGVIKIDNIIWGTWETPMPWWKIECTFAVSFTPRWVSIIDIKLHMHYFSNFVIQCNIQWLIRVWCVIKSNSSQLNEFPLFDFPCCKAIDNWSWEKVCKCCTTMLQITIFPSNQYRIIRISSFCCSVTIHYFYSIVH